ncbi:MAG: efflux RND transporter periplasmic adaptor subunit [Parvibaculaceae bacterium]
MEASNGKHRRRLVLCLLIGALAAAGGGLYAWQRSPAEASVKAAPPAAVPVSLSRVMPRDVEVTLSGLGTAQASQTVNIRPQLDGTLQSVGFSEGEDVKAGDVLARLDPRLAQAALDQAKAAKARDEAQLHGAQLDLERYSTLAKQDFASKQQRDQQQATVDQLTASIASDEAAIQTASTNLDYMTITAPAEGRMGIRNVDPGNVVHASDPTPIAVLTTLKPISLVFTLPEHDLAAVQKAFRAGPVTVTASGDDGTALGTGRLAVIDNTIDASTGTIRLKATFPNDDERIWPGAFLHATIETDRLKDALTVPLAAVQHGPDGLFVWVVKGDGTADMRPIETGAVSNGMSVIEKGLEPGDQVVTGGQYKLSPHVRVVALPAQATAQASEARDSAAPEP